MLICWRVCVGVCMCVCVCDGECVLVYVYEGACWCRCKRVNLGKCIGA